MNSIGQFLLPTPSAPQAPIALPQVDLSVPPGTIAPPEQGLLSRLTSPVTDRIGGLLAGMRGNEDARMASIYTALQLLGPSSGSTLADISRAGTQGYGVYQQARERRAEGTRKDEELKLRKEQVELQKKQLGLSERELNQRGYAAQKTYEQGQKANELKEQELKQRGEISDREIQAQIQMMRMRLDEAGKGTPGANEQAARNIATALKAKYPNLSDAQALLTGWEALLTRFGASDPGAKSQAALLEKAADYYKTLRVEWGKSLKGMDGEWGDAEERDAQAKVREYVASISSLFGVDPGIRPTGTEFEARVKAMAGMDAQPTAGPAAGAPPTGEPTRYKRGVSLTNIRKPGEGDYYNFDSTWIGRTGTDVTGNPTKIVNIDPEQQMVLIETSQGIVPVPFQKFNDILAPKYK